MAVLSTVHFDCLKVWKADAPVLLKNLQLSRLHFEIIFIQLLDPFYPKTSS